MADTITVTYKVNEDGSLSKIAKGADNAAKSTDKATESADRYSRGQKGVAGATSNSSKAFSKMQSGMGGVVGAYAALAANVFALTAFFGALQRATAVQQLTEGLTELGKASGLAMTTLSQGLVKATGNALSLEESMRSVALITSAGLDPSSIEKFGKVAKDASIALGRDTADSLARLSRGVTKLEPELLDELGIMVRLDEASENYARSIGKTANELTNFEKRQAFMNATLKQGEEKFGSIGDAVDSNPYDKLAATFNNISKGVLNFVGGPLKMLAGVLASSPTALFGVLTLVASLLAKKMVPSLGDMQEKSKAAAAAMKEQNKRISKQILNYKGLSPKVAEYQAKLAAGTATEEDHTSAVRGNNQAYRVRGSTLKHNVKISSIVGAVTGENAKGLKAHTKTVFSNIKATYDSARAKDFLARSTMNETLATIASTEAAAMDEIQNGSMLEGLRMTSNILGQQAAALRAGIANTTGLGLASVFASGAVSMLGTAAAAAATAISRIAPWIAVFTMALSVLMPLFGFIRDLFKDPAIEKYNEKSEALAKTQEELNVNLAEVDKSMTGQSRSINSAIGRHTAMNNVLDTFIGKYDELAAADPAGLYEHQATAIDNLIDNSTRLSAAFSDEFDGAKTVDELAKKRNITTAQAIEAGEEFVQKQKQIANSFKAVENAIKESEPAFTEYQNSLTNSTPFDTMVTGLEDIGKAFSGAELNKDLEASIELINKLSSSQVASLGLQQEAKQAGRILDVQKLRTGIEKELLEIQDKARKQSGGHVRSFDKHNTLMQDILGKNKHYLELIQLQAKAAERLPEHQQKLVDTVRAEIAERLKTFKTAQRTIQLSKAKEAIEAKLLSISKLTRAETVGALEDQITLGNNVLTQQNNTLRARRTVLELERDSFSAQRAEVEAKGETLKISTREQAVLDGVELLTKNISENTAKKVDESEKALQIAQREQSVLEKTQKGERALLSLQSTQNKAASKALDVAEKRAKLTQRQANKGAGLGGKQLAEDTIRIQKAGLAARIKASKEEERIKIATAKLDHVLLKARLSIIQKEIELHNSKLEDTETAIPTVEIADALSILGDTSVITQQITADYQLQRDLLTEQVNMLDENIVRQVRLTKESIKLQDIRKNALNEQKTLNSELGRQSEILNEQAKIANTKADGTPKNVIEAAKLEEQGRILRIQAMDREFALKKQIIASETALLEAKFSLLSAEMAKDGLTTQEIAVLAETRKVLDLQKEVTSQRIKTAEMELQLAKDKMDLESRSGIDKAAKAGGISGAVKEFEGQRSARNAAAEATKKAGDQAREAAKEAGKSDEEIESAVNDAKARADKNATTATTLATTQLQALQQAVALLQQIASCSCKAGAPSGGTTRDTGTEEDSTTDGKIEKPLKYQDDDSMPGSTVIASKGGPLTIGGEAIESGTTVDTGTITPPKPTIDTGTGNEDTSTGEGSSPKMSKEEAGVLARATLSGFASDFAKLGPEGEAVSAAIDGSMAIFDAFSNMGEGVQGKLQAAGAIIGAISQMTAAANKAKIAGIDKEIQAEKRRDGQSSASVGKIKALEAKKEAMKKKAFETDKKMKMAQAVIGIAQGVTSALGAPFPLNFILPALVMAMGAKQLQLISATQYQSSSASTANASMPSISMGSRSNTVDLAKGNNQGGETSYMRGASGQGGMQNFTPAFTGYKNRASGGNTGFIVGEQGPELFTPSIPGDITSADETADMEAATPTSVTFNINTIDASGVEDVLTVQRGNIIKMIRDAANEQGQLFLEAVEESKL